MSKDAFVCHFFLKSLICWNKKWLFPSHILRLFQYFSQEFRFLLSQYLKHFHPSIYVAVDKEFSCNSVRVVPCCDRRELFTDFSKWAFTHLSLEQTSVSTSYTLATSKWGLTLCLEKNAVEFFSISTSQSDAKESNPRFRRNLAALRVVFTVHEKSGKISCSQGISQWRICLSFQENILKQ